MTLYCSTAEFPAVCAGTAKMKQIDSEILTLALELEPEIKHINKRGQILLTVQDGFVTAFDATVRYFRKKFKTVD